MDRVRAGIYFKSWAAARRFKVVNKLPIEIGTAERAIYPVVAGDAQPKKRRSGS
jgi:hypothetical protein